jgi:hypothetical protein
MPIARPFHEQLGHCLARIRRARPWRKFKHLGMIERILEPDGLAGRRRGLRSHGRGRNGCWSRHRGGQVFSLGRALRDDA